MNTRKIGFILCCLTVLLSFWIGLAEAQEQAEWSHLYRLSSQEGKASEGFMVADQYGYVHVFWVESGLPDNRSIIQYARFDGETWSTPIDIFVTASDGSIGLMSPTVDQHGTLHLVWVAGGQKGPAYYASAPAHNAISAHYWSSPLRLDIPAYSVKLQVDSRGVLHLVYLKFHDEQRGVYYMHSENQGSTWSDPRWLDPEIPPDYTPFIVQFALDEANGLHIVWHYYENTEEKFTGKDIFYAHSLDGGVNWSWPIMIDESDEASDELRAAGPVLAIQDQTVHVIWAGNSDTHREYRFSTDRGETWSTPIRILGKLHGQAGDDLTVDAAGRIHYIAQIRYPKAIWHSYWDQDHWTNPSMVYLIARYDKDPEEANRIHAHNVRLAIGAGNQMVTTFTNAPDERGGLVLYAMHRTLSDIPSLSPAPTPTPTITPTPQPSPTSISSTPTPTPRKPRFVANSDSPQDDSLISGPSTPLWIAIIPALLLIVGTIAVQLLGER